MFGPDFSSGAAAVAGVVPVPASGPQPEQRVVENTGRSQLARQETGALYSRRPPDLQQLSASARQFADLLDTTGNVQIASAISGFRAGHVDMYV
jgi:hypothetical protein